MDETTKVCTRCGAEKVLDDFAVQKGRRLGRSSWCRACHSAYTNSRRKSPNDTDDRHFVMARAYALALAELKNRHPEEFDEIRRHEQDLLLETFGISR